MKIIEIRPSSDKLNEKKLNHCYFNDEMQTANQSTADVWVCNYRIRLCIPEQLIDHQHHSPAGRITPRKIPISLHLFQLYFSHHHSQYKNWYFNTWRSRWPAKRSVAIPGTAKRFKYGMIGSWNRWMVKMKNEWNLMIIIHN